METYLLPASSDLQGFCSQAIGITVILFNFYILDPVDKDSSNWMNDTPIHLFYFPSVANESKIGWIVLSKLMFFSFCKFDVTILQHHPL